MFDLKAFAVAAVVVVSCGVNQAADPPAIPADFKIVARYQPGLSSWVGWHDTIAADGKVIQATTGGRASPKASEKQLNLSKDEIASLLAKVKESDFFGLKEQYRAVVTDHPTLILEVTLDGKTHKVEVYGHRLLTDKDDQTAVKRFLQVWSEVLRKVPSPNPEQKPEGSEK